MLGVGAQKAGTTWLYAYLRQSPQFVHGYRKEYHVFDAVDLPTEQWMMDRQAAMAEEALSDLRARRPAKGGVIHRMAMCADTTFYFDYFAGLLSSGDDARFVADVTPDYGMLSADRFASIRSEFARRHVRVAPVMLLRDPVERIYSHMRMQAHRGMEQFAGRPEEALEEFHHRANFARRTRYDLTIETLDQAFGRDDVFYSFYEELFAEEEVTRLCRFLDMPYHPPELAKRRNASPRDEQGPPESTRAKVATHYADVYAFVGDRFGRDRVLALWPNARFVL